MKIILVLGVLLGLSEAAVEVVNAKEANSSLLKTFLRDKRDSHAHVDLHNDQFCVDISEYGPVEWVEEGGYEKCETEFVKKCEQKSENACADVVETVCEVVPYTECTMGIEPVDYSETELIPKEFTEQKCITTKDTVPHKKQVPECKDVTKQNCVTLWETDAYGKQQWAGNEACEPVTWKECKLVDKDVNFIIPKVVCTPEPPIWYHVPEAVAKTKETNTMSCVVKSTTNCITKTRNDCKHIYFQECKEIPVPTCEPKYVHKPTQELNHKKKCLLPDAPPAPAYGAPAATAAPATSYGSPTAAPATSYSASAGRRGRAQGNTRTNVKTNFQQPNNQQRGGRQFNPLIVPGQQTQFQPIQRNQG